MSVTTPMGPEWDKQFCFLHEAGLQGAYLALLSMSRSTSHLARLHDHHMPANCRLSLQELASLKETWTKLYGQDRIEAGTLLFDQAAQAVLLTLCDKKSLCSHYVARVNDPRAEYEGGFITSQVVAHPSSQHRGHGLHHFRVKMLDYEFELMIVFPEDFDGVQLQLRCWEYDLTETFAHQLLSLPVSRQSSSFTGQRGSEISFWYESSAKGNDQDLALQSSQQPDNLARFLENTTTLLRELNLPLNGEVTVSKL